MEIIKREIGSAKFMFACSSRGTRHGFAHDCSLFINGAEKARATCHYINRTWEVWRYQSVCYAALNKLITDEIQNKKATYKDHNGIKRMTRKRWNDFYETLKTDNYLDRLYQCREALKVKVMTYEKMDH